VSLENSVSKTSGKYRAIYIFTYIAILNMVRQRAILRLLQTAVCIAIIFFTLKLFLTIVGDESKPLPAADELRKLMVSYNTLHSNEQY